MTTKTDTLTELATGVTCNAVPGCRKAYSSLDTWQQNAHQWRVTLVYGGRSMSLDFFMGSALTNAPTAVEVLESLLTDADLCGSGFEGFCLDTGGDTDSRRSMKLYRQCIRERGRLQQLLGNDYSRFMEAERD